MSAINNNITYNVSLNDATTALLAKLNAAPLTDAQRAYFAALRVCAIAAQASAKFGSEAIFWVSEMPAGLVEGVVPGFCWMDGHTDNDEAAEEWRVKWRAEHEGDPLIAKADFPEFHVTLIFGHNPTAADAKRAIVAATPRAPFFFDEVMALGRPKDNDDADIANCWVARTRPTAKGEAHNAAVTAWLTAARHDARLNTNHADFAGGWPVAGGDMGTILPHGTLVRGLNLTAADVTAPPPLGNLIGAPFRFRYVVEWVNLKVGDLKIKLAQFHPLPEIDV